MCWPLDLARRLPFLFVARLCGVGALSASSLPARVLHVSASLASLPQLIALSFAVSAEIIVQSESKVFLALLSSLYEGLQVSCSCLVVAESFSGTVACSLLLLDALSFVLRVCLHRCQALIVAPVLLCVPGVFSCSARLV